MDERESLKYVEARSPGRLAPAARFVRLGAVRLCAVIALGGGATVAAVAQHTQSEAQVDAGQRIFQRGVFVGESGVVPRLPACLQCHGRRGQGKSEGGVRVPPIAWRQVIGPGMNGAGPRKPYDEDALRRAVIDGVDAEGRSLGVVMPRYALSAAQWQELSAYGVDDQTLRIGSVLPVSGPDAPLGRTIQAAIESVLSRVNAAGGIFGRRVNLLVVDGGIDRAGRLGALRRLLDPASRPAGDVLALVAPMIDTGDPDVTHILEESSAIVIGPLARTPGDAQRLPIYYLLPSPLEQAIALVTHLVSLGRDGPAPVRVLHDRTLQAVAMSRRLESWASGRSIHVDVLAINGPGEGALQGDRAEISCIYLGSENLLAEVIGDLRRTARCSALGVLAEAIDPRVVDAFRLSSGLRVWVAHAPGTMEMRSGRQDVGDGGVEVRAVASTELFVDAAKRSTRSIDSETLTARMDETREFASGPLARQTFTSDHRVGSHRVIVESLGPSRSR